MIKQVSVLVENKVGATYELTDLLAKNNININAISVFDTAKICILRMLVDDNEKAIKVLGENKFAYTINSVLGVPLEHQVGSLNKVLGILTENDFSVNYLYSMVVYDEKPLMVIDVDDLEEAEKILNEYGVETI